MFSTWGGAGQEDSVEHAFRTPRRGNIEATGAQAVDLLEFEEGKETRRGPASLKGKTRSRPGIRGFFWRRNEGRPAFPGVMITVTHQRPQAPDGEGPVPPPHQGTVSEIARTPRGQGLLHRPSMAGLAEGMPWFTRARKGAGAASDPYPTSFFATCVRVRWHGPAAKKQDAFANAVGLAWRSQRR